MCWSGIKDGQGKSNEHALPRMMKLLLDSECWMSEFLPPSLGSICTPAARLPMRLDSEYRSFSFVTGTSDTEQPSRAVTLEELF